MPTVAIAPNPAALFFIRKALCPLRVHFSRRVYYTDSQSTILICANAREHELASSKRKTVDAPFRERLYNCIDDDEARLPFRDRTRHAIPSERQRNQILP